MTKTRLDIAREEDIEWVMRKTGCDRVKAISMLEINQWSALEAVCYWWASFDNRW